MKNHYNPQPFLQSLMRISFLTILITATLSGLLGAASPGHAQGEELADITVRLEAENAPVEQVLRDIERQTGLTFGYSHAYMDPERRVTVKRPAEDINLEQALRQIFSGTRTTWALSNGVIKLKTWPRAASRAGVIAGTIADAETGEPMAGATMQLEGTARGASADADGAYRLENVAPGTYTLVFSFVGYKQTKAEGIQVEDGQVTTIDATLVPKTSQMEELVVEAEVDVSTAPVIEATDVDVVHTISESNMVVTGISAEQISKTPDSDAAEVVRRTPGVTLSGSYVNLRGLSDRHTATFIDGMQAPSTAQYSSSFGYDLLPAGVIDRVLTYKSPAAELPGDWGGGVVKIFTKNTSVARELQVSVKGEYDSRSSFTDYYTQKNSATDWLGYDNGLRQMPDKFLTYDRNDPVGNTAAARTLPETWDLVPARSGPNWSGKVRYYDSWKPFGLRINNLTALKYSRSTDIEDSFFGRNFLGRARATMDEDNNTTPIPEEERTTLEELKQEGFNSANEDSYTEKVRTSLMQNIGFWFTDDHRIRLKNMFNQLGNAQTSTRIGNSALFAGDFSHSVIRGTGHNYRQRTLYNGQLSGEHTMGNHRIDWRGGYSYAREQTPDRRIAEFGHNRSRQFPTLELQEAYNDSVRNNPDNYLFRNNVISTAASNSRTWNDSREDVYVAGLDYRWQLPFGPTLKAGGRGSWSSRDFKSRLVYIGISEAGPVRDYLQSGRQSPWHVMDDSVFTADNFRPDPEYLSLSGGDRDLLQPGDVKPNNSYEAERRIQAAYLSLDIPLFGNAIDLYGGVRVEQENRDVGTQVIAGRGNNRRYEDETVTTDTRSWLPSAGITGHLTEELQLRATAGKTLDRPSLQEASPFYFFDYREFKSVIGNPHLKIAEIWNFDARAEWYPAAGEQLSVGGFYKTLNDPIEQLFYYEGMDTNISWANTNEATIYGIELELRKRLDFIPAEPFRLLSVFGNAAWQHSEVQADSVELRGGSYIDMPFDKRQMQGAAPYVVNAGLSFDHPGWGTQASILYNLVGPKLVQAPSNTKGIAKYGIYQRSIQQLDLQLSQHLTPWLQAKLSVENLLNARRTEFVDANGTHEFDQGVFKPDPEIFDRYGTHENTDSIYRRYGKAGRRFSLSLKMTF